LINDAGFETRENKRVGIKFQVTLGRYKAVNCVVSWVTISWAVLDSLDQVGFGVADFVDIYPAEVTTHPKFARVFAVFTDG